MVGHRVMEPRPIATLLIGLSATLLVICGAYQFAKIQNALTLAKPKVRSIRAYQKPLAMAKARLLILGDSTGVGVGCSNNQQSIAGLAGSDFPALEIVNTSKSGAVIGDLVEQVEASITEGAPCFDIALVCAGGNDILHLTNAECLRRQTMQLLDTLQPLTRRIVWLGVANVGLAPLFVPPVSWWISARARGIASLFADCAKRRNVEWISFFEDRSQDIFSRHPSYYYSADGIHPSEHAYLYCYRKVRRHFLSAIGGSA